MLMKLNRKKNRRSKKRKLIKRKKSSNSSSNPKALGLQIQVHLRIKRAPKLILLRLDNQRYQINTQLKLRSMTIQI